MKHKRGQSLIEATFLIVASVAALMAIFGYIRSAFMHQMKSGADGIGQGLLYR